MKRPDRIDDADNRHAAAAERTRFPILAGRPPAVHDIWMYTSEFDGTATYPEASPLVVLRMMMRPRVCRIVVDPIPGG